MNDLELQSAETASASGGIAEIGLQNPKNVSNVGSALRAAGCFGATHIYYSGERYDKALPFAEAADKHRHGIVLEKVESLVEARTEGFTLVAVELAVGAESLVEFQHPEKALYLFGPEDGSLDQATVSACDHVVYMPTKGCLNLAASVNVLLYDRTVKLASIEASDELVIRSRDNRNRLVCG